MDIDIFSFEFDSKNKNIYLVIKNVQRVLQFLNTCQTSVMSSLRKANHIENRTTIGRRNVVQQHFCTTAEATELLLKLLGIDRETQLQNLVLRNVDN